MWAGRPPLYKYTARTRALSAMECIASGCTPRFCVVHKESEFPCAQPGCTNLVQAQIFHGASEFLDEGYDSRRVQGVVLDPATTQRPTRAAAEGATIGPDGHPSAYAAPRTEEEFHAYLCKECTLQQQGPREKATKAEEKRRKHRTRHHRAKHVTVSENDRTRTIDGRHVEIRVLGPGLGDATVQELKVLRALISPHLATNHSLTRLPVKIYADKDLDDMGLEREEDRGSYGVVLGVFVDSVLEGQCELLLLRKQIQDMRRRFVDRMHICRLFLHPSVRGVGISRFVMSYAVDFARFLKAEFGTHCDQVLLLTCPNNVQMNAVARSSGFTLKWEGDNNASLCNKWVYSLRTTQQEACEVNRQTRFLQHLSLPVVVRHRSDVHFSFLYNYQNQLHTAMHTMQIPSPSWYVDERHAIGLYKISDYLQARNTCPCTQEWMHAQAEFFASLSTDDHLTILTYSYRGDQMLNRYMQYGTVHDATCSRLQDRKAQWYCHSIDSFQYILFQPQLRKVYGDAFTVRDAADVQRIALLLRTWDTTMWAPVMDQHLRDLGALYERAPPLQSPMMTYRGQQRAHLFGDLCGAQSNTESRVISSSLDASVAAFFAYDIKQVLRGAPRARSACFD